MSVGYAQVVYPPSEADIDAGRDHGTPNPAQAAFESLSTPIQVLVGGFGVGKTCVGGRKSIRYMLANPGARGMGIGPTHKHAELMQQEMLRQLDVIKIRDGIDLVAAAPTSPSNRYIELTNGSRITFYSGVKKSGLLGPTVAFIWLDEVEWFDDPGEVLNAIPSRLRQQSQPGIATIHKDSVGRVARRTFITSTAQFLTGPLKDYIEERDRETLRMDGRLQDQKWRKGLRNGIYYPDTGVIVAPSMAAIGHGLTLDIVRRWQREMEPGAFRRAVRCVLEAPPEIVFGDLIKRDPYPLGHIIDWHFNARWPSLFGVDWGINHPYVFFGQVDPDRQALIIAEEWGPDGASPGETIKWIVQTAQKYGLANDRGRPVSRATAIFGDPTTNAGANVSNPDEGHLLAIEGAQALNRLGWGYKAPKHPRQRSKHLQVQLLKALLRPAQGPARLLWNRPLTVGRDSVAGVKQTNRGSYHAFSEGLKYERDAAGRIKEKIKKDGKWDHAFDGVAYACVMAFEDFKNLLDIETGLLQGAGPWHQ